MADEWGPWIGWNGGERPVAPDAVVDVIFSLGSDLDSVCYEVSDADAFNWSAAHTPIIAYRVKREPVVETADVVLLRGTHPLAYGTIQTRDGIPDMATLRWGDAT